MKESPFCLCCIKPCESDITNDKKKRRTVIFCVCLLLQGLVSHMLIGVCVCFLLQFDCALQLAVNMVLCWLTLYRKNAGVCAWLSLIFCSFFIPCPFHPFSYNRVLFSCCRGSFTPVMINIIRFCQGSTKHLFQTGHFACKFNSTQISLLHQSWTEPCFDTEELVSAVFAVLLKPTC